MKQKELADKMGVSLVTIGNYESGKSVPSFSIAVKIFKFLGIDIKEVIKEGEEENDIVETRATE